MKKLLLFLTFVLISSNAFGQAEVTDRLRQRMQSLNPVEYTRTMVLLRDYVDIATLDKQLYAMNVDLKERARIVITTLQNKANSTQGPIITYIQSQMSSGKVREFIPFWITNMIYVDATPDVLIALSQRSDVALMDYDQLATMDLPATDFSNISREAASVENGLKAIKADSLWKMGYTGIGRTVMHIDTGVDGNHVALNSRWWGNNGRPWWQAWFDPIAPSTSFPFDCGSHGTHTMGIMTGRGATDTVGVAPDARWMAAGVTDCPGASYPTMNIAAYQWAMNPDSNAGTNTDMPDVISCSWQDPSQAGSVQCNPTGVYALTLTALEASGIAVVFSCGNSGPGTSTITPPKNLSLDSVNTMSVGNVDGNNVSLPISNSSSRGPSTCGGTGTLLIKPEVVAPGTNVRSTLPGNTYGNNSGTSMASPHVAGAIALLRQVAPNLTGHQIKSILFTTARDLGTAGEDNTYGRGIIDLMAAFRRIANYPLNAYNLQAPTAGITLTSLPSSPTVYNFNWDTSSTGASYKFIFGSPNATNRQIVIQSNSNSLALTSGQLDQLLAGLGVAQGGQLVGQWDVWAFRATGGDSMKATNGPRTITLRRGIPNNTPVNLVTPSNNTTIVTSVFNSSNINFNWTKSGEGITYKVMFDAPTFVGQPMFSFQSNNNGGDSVFSIVNSTLDAMLASVAPGDSVVGQYRVYGFRNPSDSVASNQTYNLTLKRQAKGDVIVLYDSTVANCRISKDSIIAGLNARGATYDLFNKGANTGTAGISLRGYKKVILLGEGTSVASNIVKDSIKAYLAAGGTTIPTKSKLIIFAEDVGYHWARTGSTYLDADFSGNTLGFTFVSDRPTGSSGPEGLRGVRVNAGLRDSTSGPWPDVLAKSTASSLSYLYEFTRVAGNYNGVGRMASNFNVATFGVDFESLRNAVGGASGSPQRRWLNAAFDYVDQITPTNIEDPNAIPTVYELKQNFPNPFNPVTKINFSIPKQGFVSMKIYDVTGKLIAQLVNEMKSPGYYSVDFNATNLASGVYFYRIQSNDFVDVKRMMLIK